LNSKLKSNPKYEKVQSVVKTGKTTKMVETISDSLVAKRRGENYRRIKASTLVKLIAEVEPTESVFNMITETQVTETDKENADAQSILSFSGESFATTVTCTTEMLGITADTKIVLLDMRDPDEYNQCHIQEALNFPSPGITQDRQIAKLLRMKNDDTKKIILYMWDERKGTQCAKLMHEKGFNNVFLLSGGMEKFAVEHKDQLIGSQVEGFLT
jgi:centrosomal protein CEP41